MVLPFIQPLVQALSTGIGAIGAGIASSKDKDPTTGLQKQATKNIGQAASQFNQLPGAAVDAVNTQVGAQNQQLARALAQGQAQGGGQSTQAGLNRILQTQGAASNAAAAQAKAGALAQAGQGLTGTARTAQGIAGAQQKQDLERAQSSGQGSAGILGGISNLLAGGFTPDSDKRVETELGALDPAGMFDQSNNEVHPIVAETRAAEQAAINQEGSALEDKAMEARIDQLVTGGMDPGAARAQILREVAAARAAQGQ